MTCWLVTMRPLESMMTPVPTKYWMPEGRPSALTPRTARMLTTAGSACATAAGTSQAAGAPAHAAGARQTVIASNAATTRADLGRVAWRTEGATRAPWGLGHLAMQLQMGKDTWLDTAWCHNHAQVLVLLIALVWKCAKMSA